MSHLLVLVLTQPTQDLQKINFPVPKPERVGTLKYLRIWSHPPGLNRRPADYEFRYQCLCY
jgi:hypothetical protein